MRAINPKTGEVLELQAGRWVPVDGDKVPGKTAEPDAFEKNFKVSSGALESIVASAGDQLTTMGRNVRDLWAGFRGDNQAQADIIDERAQADAIRARMHDEAPIAAGVGAALPGLATLPLGMGSPMLAAMAPRAAAALPAMLSRGIAEGALGSAATNIATSAALGGLGSTTGDVAGGALEGGALAGATSMAGNMVARVRAGREALKASRAQQAAGAAVSQLDDAQREIIDGARRAGLKVTPGQALGDASMRQVEASASSNPILSPYWQQLRRENAQQINTLTARAMGEGADNVGPAVRAAAENRLGDVADDIGRRLGKVETSALHKDLIALAEKEATDGLPTSDAWKVLKRFEKGMEGRTKAVAGELADEMTGEALLKVRSKVSKEMRGAFGAKDPSRGQILGEALDVIDKHIARAARARGDFGLVDDYGKFRDQWSVLRAMDNGGATADGQVLAGQTARLMRESDKTRYWGLADESGQTMQLHGTGKLGESPLGDYYDALRFASSQLGKDIVGDSGTATRLSLSQAFDGGFGPTLARAGSYAVRRLTLGPLAQRYMNASPEAAQAWNAARTASGLEGWRSGLAAGGATARAGQAGATGIMGGQE